MRNPYVIRTFAGVDMDPFDPHESEINIGDIAHSLSLLCRANGHISHFFSVAQHCLNCEGEAAARALDEKTRMFCLLHDATECYISDLIRPIKCRFPLYSEAEDRLSQVIYSALGLSLPTAEQRAAVKSIDDCMLYHEFSVLGRTKSFDEASSLQGTPDFSFKKPDMVEKEYINRYNILKEFFGDE